jgi:hypothetical protein
MSFGAQLGLTLFGMFSLIGVLGTIRVRRIRRNKRVRLAEPVADERSSITQSARASGRVK